MNSFKSFCMMLVLFGIGYGVYRSLHLKNPQDPPPGVDTSIPQIDLQLPGGPMAGNNAPANESAPLLTANSGGSANGFSSPSAPAPQALAAQNNSKPSLLTPAAVPTTSLGIAPPASIPSTTNNSAAGEAPRADQTASALLPATEAKEPSSSTIAPPPTLPPLRSPGETSATTVTATPSTPNPGLVDSTLPSAAQLNGVGMASSPPPATEVSASTNQANASSNVNLASSVNTVEPSGAGSLSPYEQVMKQTRELIEQRLLPEALARLTQIYEHPALSAGEQEQTILLLNQLAGTVIYSREHWLAEPHRVQTGETLFSIAEKNQVTWEMLAKINGLTNPNQVPVGEFLKVARGPYRAEVNLAKQRVTLFLRDMYAGTFQLLNVGNDVAVTPGDYAVLERQYFPAYQNQPQQNAQGQRAADPNNPFGMFALDLGRNIKLHGHGAQVTPHDPRGSLRVSAKDSEDLHDLLGKGSTIVIRR